MLHYRQTTPFTCAAASLMMILNHLKADFKLTKENEFRIWHTTAALPTRGSSIYALAIFAKKELNIPVKVVVGEQEYKFPNYRFKSYKKKEIEQASYSTEIFYKDAIMSNIKVEERDARFEELQPLLEERKVILLRINKQVFRGSRAESHYMPVYSYSKGKFKMMDPREGEQEVSEEKLREAFETVRTKCKRDNRMIIFG